MREATSNRYLVRFVAAYFAATTSEWAIGSASMVYAYQHGGTRIAGRALIAMLIPLTLVAIPAGAITDRHRPNRVCLAALALQTVSLALGAVVGFTEGPVALMVACSAAAFVALVLLRPGSAVLAPSIVRSTRELTVANLWLGLADSASALTGPLLAASLIGMQGVGLLYLACATCSGLAACSMVPLVRNQTNHARRTVTGQVGALELLRRAIDGVRTRKGASGVLAVAGGQYILLGALDLMTVVLAKATLHLPDSGPPLLSTAIGFGALIGALGSMFAVKNNKIARLAMTALLLIASGCCLLGAFPTLATAILVLPLIGLGRCLINLSTRMLLQRTVPPHVIGSVFATIELLAGIGLLVGALVAQFVVAHGNVETCFIVIGCFYGLFLALTWKSLRTADASADVPVVAISLLRSNPAFSLLPPLALEAVARTAVEVPVPAGEKVIVAGDVGDRFYIVADGIFRIERPAKRIEVSRGASFGEVALLANVPRTATVTALTPGLLFAIDRVPFLEAMTGSTTSHRAMWSDVRTMNLPVALDDPYPGGTSSAVGPG
jgi:MFS family permease